MIGPVQRGILRAVALIYWRRRRCVVCTHKLIYSHAYVSARALLLPGGRAHSAITYIMAVDRTHISYAKMYIYSCLLHHMCASSVYCTAHICVRSHAHAITDRSILVDGVAMRAHARPGHFDNFHFDYARARRRRRYVSVYM